MNKTLNIPMKWGIVKCFLFFVNLQKEKENIFVLKETSKQQMILIS